MSDTVIKVENIAKKYVLAHQQQERYKSFRDEITNKVKSLGDKLRYPSKNFSNPTSEEFWALKDVSFEIKQGDRVGIIGRNGAGKSTLLKILSRITEPTKGRISIKGRIASLLEVGTGFHPELTGRENIYLNGAILGMSRVEIKRKFDEIVAFAEVEKFLDTPVKRYSSGMYVRLAFAVAAHLEPEILIVDEVLAVGDAAFQKKCLGKMENVAQEGRTILFVSHQMAAIRSLCNIGILFERGQLIAKAPIEEITHQYINSSTKSSIGSRATFQKPAKAPIWLESASILCNGEHKNQLHTGESLTLLFNYRSNCLIREPKIGFVIYSVQGDALINANNHYQKTNKPLLESVESGIIACKLGQISLMEGKYFISLWLGDSNQNYHYLEYALSFEVIDRDIWETAKTPPKVSFLWWPTEFEFHRI